MNLVDIKQLLIPYNNDYNKKRFGKHNDGGYILYSDILHSTEYVYSFGVSYDISFETDLLKHKQIDIFMYDGTVNHEFKQPNLKFINHNISSDYFINELIKNNHLSCKNLLLKCDIEGAEFELIENLPEQVLQNFSQICIEVHNINEKIEESYDLFFKINKFFTLFHIHGNNWAPLIQGIPNVLELSYLRNDLLKNKNILANELPDPILDSPNKEDVLDYKLNWWLQQGKDK